MANTFDANAFFDNFQSGFGFVESFQRRKRDEARLEDRLTQQRQDRQRQQRRQDLADQHVIQNRGFAADARAREEQDRARRLSKEDFADEATVALSNINATNEELAPYAKDARVAARMAENDLNSQRQADLELITRRQSEEQPGDEVTPDEVAQEEQGFAAVLPPEGAGTPHRRLTDAEINALSFTDPAGAKRLRDEQIAAADAVIEDREARFRDPTGPSGGPGSGMLSVAEQKKAVVRDSANSQWDAYGNAADIGGDSLRSAPASQQVSEYWKARGNISDTSVRDAADARVQPAITATIPEQTEILRSVEPGSLDFNNAKRKLQEAIGLAETLQMDYKLSDDLGLISKGLPTNGRNPELTARAIEAGTAARGTVLPRDRNATRMDETVVGRTTTGRQVPRTKLNAAFRLLQDGIIGQESYNSVVNTGNLPAGVTTSVVQRDPNKPTYIEIRDSAGNFVGQRLLSPGNGGVSTDVISDQALSQLNLHASAYDSANGNNFGTDSVQSFLAALQENKTLALQRGYDYNSTLDVTSLYQRYMDIFAVKNAYDAEWRLNGEWNPEFTTNIGSMADALFSNKLDAAIGSGELEFQEGPRGGETIRSTDITPLSGGSLTPAQIRRIQQDPQFEHLSPREIQAGYDAEVAATGG